MGLVRLAAWLSCSVSTMLRESGVAFLFVGLHHCGGVLQNF